MTQLDRFQQILTREGIRYFNAREAFYLGGSNALLQINTLPPEHLWPNILPTLRVLDEARHNLGFPLILTSVYRNAAYNKAVGGATGSYHMQFRACDVQPLHQSADRLSLLFNEVHRLRRVGRFAGGIGRYPTFVHVDTRGVNADF